MNRIVDFQIEDYGIEHAQYFQGHGTAYTGYSYSALGAGDSYADALADALEQAACNGAHLQVEDSEIEEHGDTVADIVAAHAGDDDGDFAEECELYYYVGLRWNE